MTSGSIGRTRSWATTLSPGAISPATRSKPSTAIGKIDEASNDVGQSYVIVDTGPWILGKKVMLPAGVVKRVDEQEEKVWVDRTKDQIKDSPEYDEALVSDTGYRDELGTYYGPGGRGYRGSDETI